MRRLFWASAVLAAAMIASPVAMAGDQEIAQSIIRRLDAQKQAGKLKGFSVDLEVQDGVATVRGKVASPAQQQAVLDVARWTTGVTKVRNGIQVDPKLNGAASQATTSVPTPSSRQMPSTDISRTSAPKVPTLQSTSSAGADRLAAARAATMRAAQQRESQEAHIREARLKVAAQEAEQRREMEQVIARQMEEARAVRQAAATQADLQASRILKASATAASNPIPAPPSSHSVATRTQQQFKPLPQRAGVPVPSGQVGYAAPMGKAPIYRTQGAPYSVHPAMAQGGGYVRQASHPGFPGSNVMHSAQPIAAHPPGYHPVGGGAAPARYDHPYMPAYSWPSYASYPNYAAVTYPKQYSAQAWPYIGPFHPYPQVPLGWRKVTLEWDDGWWMLDFRSK